MPNCRGDNRYANLYTIAVGLSHIEVLELALHPTDRGGKFYSCERFLTKKQVNHGSTLP